MIFVDTESNIADQHGDKIHTLKLGYAKYWRPGTLSGHGNLNECLFRAANEFWDFVDSWVHRKCKVWVIAHNWSFDWLILDGHNQLLQRGWRLAHWYQKATVTMFTYRRDDSTLKIVDNMNIFPLSLRALGAAIGSEKGSVDFEQVSDADLISYCKQDVQVMIDAWASWLSFLDTYNLGNFAPTLASQAFNAYRHNHMQHKIYIHNNHEATLLERASYHGGRTEVFRQGKYDGETYYKLDVNAMYPSVMQRYEYPTRLLNIHHNITQKHLFDLAKRYQIVANVHVRLDEPVLPLHIKGHRCYPIGDFRTIITTPELEYIWQRGTILGVDSVAIYDHAPIFSDWVTFIYGLEQDARRSGDTTRRFQCKLLRNSLYGKFGQRDLERELLGDAEGEGINEDICYVASDSTEVREHNFAGQRWRDTQGPASFNAFIAIASHVTANARLALWHYIVQAGRENVYYVDTDSLIVNRRGYENLLPQIDATRLGQLKLEGETTSIDIRAPKDYSFGDENHLKGVSRDAEMITEALWAQQQWPSIPAAYRRGEQNHVHTRRIVKRLSRDLYSGVVGSDGWLEPFRVQVNSFGVTEVLPGPGVPPPLLPAS